MKFDSEAQRLAHPLAKLIPKPVWDDIFFRHELSDDELMLMQPNSLQNLARVHEILSSSYRSSGICLLYAHPHASEILIENAAAFHLSLEDLLFIAVSTERNDMIHTLTTTFPEIKNQLTNAFIQASKLGYLSVIEQLITLSSNDVQALIKADDYRAFRDAGFHGNLPAIDRLIELAPSELQNMIKAGNYAAFCAGSEGELAVMERLMEIAPDDVQNMIKANDYGAFRWAAWLGYLPGIERLMEIAPSEVQNMIKARNYCAFDFAVLNDHLPVVERLMEIAPSEVQNMVESFLTYRSDLFFEATAPKQTLNRLLLFSTVLDFIEQHERECGVKYTHPFITQQLNLLRTQQTTLETEQVRAVFNVDADKARLCFYMLRNLIRRNDVTLQDDIRFLLGIPAVKALVHTAVTPNQPNELIRLAITTGNQNAAALLLTLPEVRVLAEQNDFYRNEVRGGFDLRAVARDNESSMRALTTGEQRRLDQAVNRYKPIMDAEGGELLFKKFRTQLTDRYLKNPARVQTETGQEIKLPVTWYHWCKLRPTLSADTQKRALQAYYQHKDHTALRYLSKPNPWMAENAAYVNRGEGTQSWSTFEEYKLLITMLWLAAKDTSSDISVAPTDGYTVETRIDRFIDELALLGRAHNWDEQRYKMDEQGNLLVDEDNNPVMEEYDDAQGDKPSCYSGVKRRLFQSVLGHSLLKFLTLDDIKQELRDVVREYFKQHITDENRQAIHDAWVNLCEPTSYNALTHASLNELNLSASTQAAFIEHLTVKYPKTFDQDPAFKTYIERNCSPIRARTRSRARARE